MAGSRPTDRNRSSRPAGRPASLTSGHMAIVQWETCYARTKGSTTGDICRQGPDHSANVAVPATSLRQLVSVVNGPTCVLQHRLISHKLLLKCDSLHVSFKHTSRNGTPDTLMMGHTCHCCVQLSASIKSPTLPSLI